MPEIEQWIADNYDGLVADVNRGVTYESLAVSADAKGSPELAAWARERAARAKKDVTPATAKPAGKSVRDNK